MHNVEYCKVLKGMGTRARNGLIITNKPANIYLFKVNNRNFRKMCGICSKLTIKIPERGHCCRSGVFNVNFEHISLFLQLFLLVN